MRLPILCVFAVAGTGCSLLVDSSAPSCPGNAEVCSEPGADGNQPSANDGAMDDCPEGWILGPTGSCYFPLGTTNSTMQEAHEQCAGLVEADPPPHLVTFETEAEHIFIRDNILPAGEFWIGLCDCDGWSWLTGVPLDAYDLLRIDDVSGQCAKMVNAEGGVWSTRRCGNRENTSLCEIDGLPTVVLPP